MKSEDTNDKTLDSGSGYVDRFSRFIDNHKRSVTYTLYSAAAVGSLIAIRSLRLFHQFNKPSHVPKEYVEQGYNIFGYVESSEFVSRNNSLVPKINITHIPIFGKINRQTNTLPIYVSGLTIDSGHLHEAEHDIKRTSNKKVKITLLDSIEDGNLFGRVYLKKYGIWSDCIGCSLISLGVASISEGNSKDKSKEAEKYIGALQKASRCAQNRKVGIWRVNESEKKKTFFQYVKELF